MLLNDILQLVVLLDNYTTIGAVTRIRFYLIIILHIHSRTVDVHFEIGASRAGFH